MKLLNDDANFGDHYDHDFHLRYHTIIRMIITTTITMISIRKVRMIMITTTMTKI